MMLKRLFADIPTEKAIDIGNSSIFTSFGIVGGAAWDDLLRSKRILIVAQAGMGKTYECRQRKRMLCESGKPAFFLDLATLSGTSVRDMLPPDEELRLDQWLRSQSEVATFFLDSIDELKLTLGSFELALTRLSKVIHGQTARARVVITSRPTSIDEELVRRILPVAQQVEEQVTGDSFAAVVLGQKRAAAKDAMNPVWRSVVLQPLSEEQISLMAEDQGITDSGEFIKELRRRHATDFARRPQDLIELCADWRHNKSIRNHYEQVKFDVTSKLKPRSDHKERAQLSPDRAFEGASRLALASLLTRKLTLRYSAEADVDNTLGAPLDPADILSDWTADERETLLRRGLFGVASYGRVQFHHRTVIEWLAASRLQSLLSRGMSPRNLTRLLLSLTAQGKQVVRPSLRPVAAWLSLTYHPLQEIIREAEPDTLLNFGDPELLTSEQRSQILRAYVNRYRCGGRRGMSAPWLQLQRFASKDLGQEIKRLWMSGVENPEIRELLLRLIGIGGVTECSEIAYQTAVSPKASDFERHLAVDAMAEISDSRIPEIISSLEHNQALWPDSLARSVVILLFPKYLNIDQFCSALSRIPNGSSSSNDFTWQLPRLIDQADFSTDELNNLRHQLTTIILKNTSWSAAKCGIESTMSHLSPALSCVCLILLRLNSVSLDLAKSIAVGLSVKHRDYIEEEPCKKLKLALSSASTGVREAVFLACDLLNENLNRTGDVWQRFFRLQQGPVELDIERDRSWIVQGFADQDRPESERALLLHAAIQISDETMDRGEYLRGLIPFVADEPNLLQMIDAYLSPPERSLEYRSMEAISKQRHEDAERQLTERHESWKRFWIEVSKNPDAVFDVARERNTAWDLWNALRQVGDESRSTGWDRTFIETNFSKIVADKLRLAMMKVWREDCPTLRSERPDDKKNTYFLRWQFGHAGITAEAEDRGWATKLNHSEAYLAARYVPLQLNGFAIWVEDIAIAHPKAIDEILGEELSRELAEDTITDTVSLTLQSISQSGRQVIANFIPRLEQALDFFRFSKNKELQRPVDRLAQLIELLLNHGDDSILQRILKIANSELSLLPIGPYSRVWLAAVLRVDPGLGLTHLQSILGSTGSEASKFGEGLIASLFGTAHHGPLAQLRSGKWSPAQLLALLKIAYSQVRPEDDVKHEGAWSPDGRDHAEGGRNAILNALLNTKGEDGWAAKVELSQDPMLAHFRHRAIAIAEERAAEEADCAALTEAAVRSIDAYREAPPVTRSDMFALMVDRLDGLEDLLLRDASPRAAWALIKDETVMRRIIARELEVASNNAYFVDEEAVTADEKRTDIRLISSVPDQQAVIELKIGEKNRTALELRNALRQQLVNKYMASENSRCGCLLITAGEKTWIHPETQERLDLPALIAMLNREAERIASDMAGSLFLIARGIDLRARLPTEKAKSK